MGEKSVEVEVELSSDELCEFVRSQPLHVILNQAAELFWYLLMDALIDIEISESAFSLPCVANYLSSEGL